MRVQYVCRTTDGFVVTRSDGLRSLLRSRALVTTEGDGGGWRSGWSVWCGLPTFVGYNDGRCAIQELFMPDCDEDEGEERLWSCGRCR